MHAGFVKSKVQYKITSLNPKKITVFNGGKVRKQRICNIANFVKLRFVILRFGCIFW